MFQRAHGAWPRLRWPVALATWLLAGLVVVGGLVSAADPGSRHVRVVREVSGTITIVNVTGAKFCLTIDGTSEQYCSEAYQLIGSVPLAVGEHVTGTVVLISTGPTTAQEGFIVTDPPPAP